MAEFIKLSKTVTSTDNDYDYSGSPLTVDLSQNVSEVIQTVTNDIKGYNRPSTKATVKPEKRVFNLRLLTDKIVVKGKLTRNTEYDATSLKNQILAMQQSPGLMDLYWRKETFAGTDTPPFNNPKNVVMIQAKFTDSIRKPFARDDGIADGDYATTTLSDSTKSWTTNAWAGAFVFIVGGTGIGQGSEIQSNTSTKLTFSTISNQPDATSYYIITSMKEDEIAYDFSLTFLKAVSRT